MTFTETTLTGDIVTTFPAASKIFKANKIDFCCGGNRPIGEVLADQGLSMAILEELNALYGESKSFSEYDWNKLSDSEIVDIILEEFHVPTYVLFDELTPLVNKVMTVHSKHNNHLFEVNRVFDEMKDELLLHFKKEEVMLFPHIKQYPEMKTEEFKMRIVAMVQQMEREHDVAGDIFRKLREVTSDFQVPESGCDTFRLLYFKLEELESLTHEHIHTENNILFRRFK